MAIKTINVNILGRDILFQYPDSGDMSEQILDIFAGKEYPLPHFPAAYKIRTIVDIGSNVGAAAIWFLAHNPFARMICFEPAAENFTFLQKNLTPFPHAQAHQFGLFSTECQTLLHLGADHCMQHSIIFNNESSTSTECISLKRASVEFDRLVPTNVNILKIDTEGCEVPILMDLGQARLNRVDIIYIEWHSEKDRLAIDALLCKIFVLVRSAAHMPHRGTACYMSAALLAQVPNSSKFLLTRPTETASP